ncbi:MAG: DMT family transporter, partial [Candidatus Eremiobacteraeota bacterium]|nr:DMT family transporter [Candidatus Eremiobacteraeota bacterium]
MNGARGRAPVLAALAILALIWGYTWVGIKVATLYASPQFVAGARLGLATLVLFAALAVARRSLRPTPFAPTVVLGLLQTTGWTLLQTFAVAHSGAGKAAILGYTMPFWAALLAWPVLGEKIRGLQWAAFALAAVGLTLIVAPGARGSAVANAAAVGAGLSWGASAVWA